MPIQITQAVSIKDEELDLTAILSQGKGGQNVNKVSTAIHLRFDVPASSLPEFYKQRLLLMRDRRLSKDGVIVIKSQDHRSQEKNKLAAFERLKALILEATVIHKKRRPTKPSKGARRRRMDSKTRRGSIKKTRGQYRPD